LIPVNNHITANAIHWWQMDYSEHLVKQLSSRSWYLQ